MGADGPGKAEIAASELALAGRDRGPAGTTASGPGLRLSGAERDETERTSEPTAEDASGSFATTGNKRVTAATWHTQSKPA